MLKYITPPYSKGVYVMYIRYIKYIIDPIDPQILQTSLILLLYNLATPHPIALLVLLVLIFIY